MNKLKQNLSKITKNSKAKINANSKYNKKHYQNISFRSTPDNIQMIKYKAQQYGLSVTQLIIEAVAAYTKDNDI